MQICDLIKFDRESYFGGAVQANWFYESDKVRAITGSYVFHGPKYHGVNEEDTTDRRYKLHDTASYALELFKKIQSVETNRFNMTIAGYGTGKSHLAVTLAALFSGHDNTLRQIALSRIESADAEIARQFYHYTGKNLVLIYNGMSNFNLDSETLRLAKLALAQHGMDSSVLMELTQQYEQGRSFVERTFERFANEYRDAFPEQNEQERKEFILCHIEERDVFQKVNKLYFTVNGSYIQQDKGISAGDILELLAQKYCVEQKIFDRILILFDEFGRYIEYTAANPMIAGDSALQQIFEAVQNSQGTILFDAFIQSDLNAYLSRIDKTANIIRYVGRYENSDKYYLSSNFETILANLLVKQNEQQFENIVAYNIETKYEQFNKRMYMSFMRWAKKASDKSVWSKQEMYHQVIAKGCYPLHPFAVWFLSNTADWMQQRSTIAFTEKMFDAVKEQKIDSKWIPYIYAVDIIDSDLFQEMLNSENKGLVQSQYCLQYDAVIRKYGDKLNEEEKKVLKAILIIDLCKFETTDRSDCLTAIRYCAGIKDDEAELAVKSLENQHGVIVFDEITHRFDFLEEANGLNDYKRIFVRKKLMNMRYNGIVECDDELRTDFGLDKAGETAFALEHHINSSEWRFEKRLIDTSQLTQDIVKNWCYATEHATDGEAARGLIIYLYLSKNKERDIEIMHSWYQQFQLSKKPILIQFLIDEEGILLDLLRTRKTINAFSESEQARFARFIIQNKRDTTRKICRQINEMLSEHLFMTEKGVTVIKERSQTLYTRCFSELYSSAVPFVFDGFERKATPQAKKNLFEMCAKMYDGSMVNAQMYQSFQPALKNRIQAVLMTNVPNSWQVLDSRNRLCEPQNPVVKKLYHDLEKKLSKDKAVNIGMLFNSYLNPPYGLNRYSLTLFIMYVICYLGNRLQICKGGEPLRKAEFSTLVLENDRKLVDTLPKLQLRLNEKTSDDQIEELYHTIMENQSVEFCGKYLGQLERIKNELDDFEKYRDKIATAERYAKDGKRLYTRIYTENLEKQEQRLAECRNFFSLLNIAHMLKVIKPCISGDSIDEDFDYVYSQEYCERVQKLLSEAKLLLHKNFDAYLRKMKCASDSISEFRKNHKQAARELSATGFQSESEKLLLRVEEVITETEIRQKYESSLTEIDKDIAMMGEISSLNYQKCAEFLEKLHSWRKFLNSASDLSITFRKQYTIKIDNAEQKLIQRKQEILTYADKLTAWIQNGNSDDLQKIIQELQKAESFSLPENYQEIIRAVKDDIDTFLSYIKSIRMENAELLKLRLDYEEKWRFTVCRQACLKLIHKIETSLEKKRAEWMKVNVIDISAKIENMTASECMHWKSTHETYPDFLTESDITELKKFRERMDYQLQTQRIQGVVSMYSKLTDAEKKECIQILLKMSPN